MVFRTYTFDNFAQFNSVFEKMRTHLRNKNYNYSYIDVSPPYAITELRCENGKKPYLQVGGINSQEGEGENKWTLSIRRLTNLNENELDELTDVFDKYIIEAREKTKDLEQDWARETCKEIKWLEYLLDLHKIIEGDCMNILVIDYDMHSVEIEIDYRKWRLHE